MTDKSYLRGHEIEYKNNKWIYSDTGETTANKRLYCGYCGIPNTIEGHDGCLGNLIGVMNACCGHGRINEAYVQFWDGECVRGRDAIVVMDILKKNSN